MLHELLNALEETLFMIFAAGLLTWIIGLPLGAILSVTAPEKFLANNVIHKSLNFLIHTTCSVPYIVLMIAVIPFTRLIIGSTEGSVAAVVPLTLAAVPTFAGLTEKAINHVQAGLIEAAKTVGASNFQIIYKILIPEALPNIIKSLTTTLVHLVGYSTIAGALGAGGLGGIIIAKGYQSFQTDYVLSTLVLLIVLVQIIQACGDYIANGSLHPQNNI